MKKLQKADSGFTLIEVLVGIGIAGIVLALVYGAFTTAISSIGKGEEKLEIFQRFRVLERYFRTDIESCFHVYGTVPFVGSESLVSFIRAGGEYGFFHVQYEVTDGKFSRTCTKGSIDMMSKSEQQVVFQNVESIQFEYFNKLQNTWVSTWDSQESGCLPDAVRLKIVVGYSGENTSLPEIIASPYQGKTIEEGS